MKPTTRKRPSPYQKAAAKTRATRGRAKAAVTRKVKKIAKAKAKAQEAMRALSPEGRAQIINNGEDALWRLVPEGIQNLGLALHARKVTTAAGQIIESKDVPDHFIRLQAIDRLFKTTILHEDRDMRQQVIIYNAIGGAFADRLRTAGWTGTQIVPMPEIPK